MHCGRIDRDRVDLSCCSADDRRQKRRPAYGSGWAHAAVTAADAELRRWRADQQRSQDDLIRIRRLAETGTVSQQALERAETEYRTLTAATQQARAALDFARHEVSRAEAALMPAGASAGGGGVTVSAPITGAVLRIIRDSEGPVSVGTPLVEIGDPDDIEIMVDLLSEDAVSVAPGDIVRIRGWGGGTLSGKVRLIEPYAFTKISALGIEEQRVNVLIEIDGSGRRLGHGFRVRTDIIVWSATDIIRVPMTALFKSGPEWSVYRLQRGRARLTKIQVDHMNGHAAEIVSGLGQGDLVIEHPSRNIADGVKVKRRSFRVGDFVGEASTAQIATGNGSGDITSCAGSDTSVEPFVSPDSADGQYRVSE